MEIDFGNTEHTQQGATWRETLASLASGLVICAMFLVALALAGSP